MSLGDEVFEGLGPVLVRSVPILLDESLELLGGEPAHDGAAGNARSLRCLRLITPLS